MKYKLIACGLVCLTGHYLFSADVNGTWTGLGTPPDNLKWNNGSNWSCGGPCPPNFPDGTIATAAFNSTASGRTITLGQDITIGSSLSALDITSAANPITITGANNLTLAQNPGFPGFHVSALLSSANHVISCNQLSLPLSTNVFFITTSSPATFTISSNIVQAIGGVCAIFCLTNNGSAIVLSGTNDWGGFDTATTGSLNIQGGIVSVGSSSNLPNRANSGIIIGDPQAPLLNADAMLRTTGGFSYTRNIRLGDRPFIEVQGAAVTFSGIVSTSLLSAAFTKSGPGTLVFQGANTYTHPTVITGGALQIGAANNLESTPSLTFNGTGATLHTTASFTLTIPFTATSAGIFDVDPAITTTLTGVVSGSSGLTKQGTGTLSTQAANLYSGGSTINAGTFALSGAGDLVSTGFVNTAASGASFDISAAGGDRTIGDLSGVSGSTVALGANRLTVGTATPTITFAGAIGGTGGLTKQSSGILVLSGASNYSGQTQVTGGTLQVDGSLNAAGSVLVNAGATLSGTGTVGSATINGFVAPGDSIGTLFTGDIAINGRLLNEISPLPASDLINSSGTVTLNPGSSVQVIPEDGSYVAGTRYLIIQSVNPIMGTFGSLVGPAGFALSLDYSMVGQVFLVLSSNNIVFTTPFPQSASFSINPRNVANNLNAITLVPGSDLMDVVNILVTMSDPQQGLNELHPALYNVYSLSQENSTFSVRKAIANRLWDFEQDYCLCRPECYPVWNLWATPFGAWAHQSRMHKQLGFGSWTTGAVVGLDRNWESFDAGIAAAYTYNHIDWSRAHTHGNVQSGYGSLYGSWFTDCYYVEGAVTGAYNRYHGKRGIFFESSMGTVDRIAHNSHSGYTLDAFVQAGLTRNYGCCTGCGSFAATFNPFIGFDWLYIHRGRFTEHGADSLNLKVQSNDANLLRSEVGFNWAFYYKSDCITWVPELGLSYVNESRFNGKKETANFVGFLIEFDAFGLNPSRNLLVPEAGITAYFWNDSLAVSLYYDAELQVQDGLAKKYWTQEAMLSVLYRF